MDPAPPVSARRAPATPPSARRRAYLAVTICFVVHGAVLANWTPRIPTVKAHLQLSDGTLGFVLLGAPVGALAGGLSGKRPVLARSSAPKQPE